MFQKQKSSAPHNQINLFLPSFALSLHKMRKYEHDLQRTEHSKEIVLEAAKQIMMAARTAPKGKGVDIIEIITLSHDSLPTLSENMRSEGKNAA